MVGSFLAWSRGAQRDDHRAQVAVWSGSDTPWRDVNHVRTVFSPLPVNLKVTSAAPSDDV